MITDKERMTAKFKSNSGETIAETLVSLLISSLALVMLAGAISAGSGIVTRSREKLDKYYEANEVITSMTDSNPNGTEGIEIDDEGKIIIDGPSRFDADVKKVTNSVFSDKQVVAYRLSD